MSSYVPVQLAYHSVEPHDGPGNKEPIIFLHGLTGSKENWDSLIHPVVNTTKRKVYAVDSRNHGDSEWSDDFNFNMNVDDLLHFMDKMSIPKAIIVGHSMGGLTAILTALREPKRVERIVVEDISARRLSQATCDLVATYVKWAKAAIEQVPAGVDEETAVKLVLEFWKKLMPKELRRPDERPVENHMLLKKTADGRFTFKYNTEAILRALKNSEELMPEPSGLFEGPACFIYGKLSTFQVGSDKEHIKTLFSKAEFVGIENADHNVHFDCPQEYQDALMDFLQKG